MSDQAIRDPGMYAKMSEPFESREAMDAALKAFFDELYALRVKHKIPDVTYVVSATVAGDEACYVQSGHIGNSSMKAALLATAYGQARAEVTSYLDEAVSAAEQDASSKRAK